LKVEPVSRQRGVWHQNTGQIESLPNQQVEVTTPVRGTVTRLLVQPGDQVSAGQAVAIMTSQIGRTANYCVRPSSGSNRLYQQAQTDLRLAQQNFAQQQKIAATDVAQAGHK